MQAAQVDTAGITVVRKSFDARKEKVFKWGFGSHASGCFRIYRLSV